MEYFKLHLILGMVIHSKKSNVVGFNSVQNFSTNSYKKLNAFPCELSLEAAICKLYNIICFQAPNSTVLFNFDWSRSLVINNIRELPRYKVPQNIISTFSLKCILLLEIRKCLIFYMPGLVPWGHSSHKILYCQSHLWISLWTCVWSEWWHHSGSLPLGRQGYTETQEGSSHVHSDWPSLQWTQCQLINICR